MAVVYSVFDHDIALQNWKNHKKFFTGIISLKRHIHSLA